MELIHLHLVKEYIVRLSKRRVVLKTGEQQQQLAGHILANADDIQRFCTQHVSPAPRRLRAPPSPASAGQNLCGPQAPFGTGQPPPTRPVLAGVPSGLAASSPPHACRDHSPARPQCHQNRGGHLCHLLPRLQVRMGHHRTWAVSTVWQAPHCGRSPFRAGEARMLGTAARSRQLAECRLDAGRYPTTHSLVLTATL